MNTYTEAFYNAFQSIMPQFGIEDIILNDIVDAGSKIMAPEIVCIIGIVGDLRGNVVYGMSSETALKIAGLMMGGMELEEFDELAQSAIAELGNMLSGTACTELSLSQITVDVSTPTLMTGTFSVSANTEKYTRIALTAAEMPFDILLSLDKK